MGHTLIALIIKTQTEKEARLKAEDVRDVICGTESLWGTIFDWGVIIDGQDRPPAILLFGLQTDGYQKKKHIPFMNGSIVLVEYYAQIQKMRRNLLKAVIKL